MAGKKPQGKTAPKGKAEAKSTTKGSKGMATGPKPAAAPKAVASPPPASATVPAEKPKPVAQRHGIPMPARGSKFFGAPNQGKRPGPRVPPAHPVHMPTGNRRGG